MINLFTRLSDHLLIKVNGEEYGKTLKSLGRFSLCEKKDDIYRNRYIHVFKSAIECGYRGRDDRETQEERVRGLYEATRGYNVPRLLELRKIKRSGIIAQIKYNMSNPSLTIELDTRRKWLLALKHFKDGIKMRFRAEDYDFNVVDGELIKTLKIEENA